ncbi:MAG: dolichyl-phosphate beta-glucosyltransferase [Candidatus Aminicenantales bacterium]|jgi:dolichyl-phosphate beta-glucosyltransferase
MRDRIEAPAYLSIVIPAYNEAKRLGPSLEKILGYLKTKPFASEVIVVDDGSRDKTAEVAGAVLEGRVPFRIVRSDTNHGKGYAVKAGVLASAGQVVLFTDADLSTPIEELDKFLSRLGEGFDIVIGSRALPGCDIRVRQAAPREALGKFFNRLVRLSVMKGCRDTQCGFKVFRRAAAMDLFSRLQTEGFSFDVELLLLARKAGYRIAEVPVVWCNSRPSRVRIVQGSWQMLKEIMRIRRLR